MMMIPYTMTPTSITLVLDSRHRQLDKSHVNFEAVKDKLKALQGLARFDTIAVTRERDGLLADLRQLVDIPTFIARASLGRIQVSDNEVRYDGAPIHGHVAERLLELLREGFDLAPLMRFLSRLHDSHIKPKDGVDLRDEFLRWVEKSHMPLTEDGCILAYKFVRHDYTDSHSGKVDNSVGAVIPRLESDGINTDRHQTCAASGYHFCSYAYLGGGNPHVMIVKIAPEDIASFPWDAEEAKGRCLFYEVVSEVPKEELEHRRIESRAVVAGDRESVDDAIAGRRDNDWASAEAESVEDDEGEVIGIDDYERAVDAAPIEMPHSDVMPERSMVGRERWLARLKGIQVSGRRLTSERLMEMVQKYGQREASRRTGIPRATLQGWLE